MKYILFNKIYINLQQFQVIQNISTVRKKKEGQKGKEKKKID